MITSQPMSLKSVICRDDTALSPAQLGYMNSRAKAKAHASVLKLFVELSQKDEMTRAFLARRLGKRPEQITRWLGAPGNWTLDTLSNLLAAMGHEPIFGVQPLNELRQGNEHHPLAAYVKPPSVHIINFGGTVLRDTRISSGRQLLDNSQKGVGNEIGKIN